MRLLTILVVVSNIIFGFSQPEDDMLCRERVHELCSPCEEDRQCWRSCVIQNMEELSKVGCQAPPNSQEYSSAIWDAIGSASGRKLLIGPRWTWDPAFEKPAEEKNMGTWTAGVYSADQQKRLGVNAWGNPDTQKPDAVHSAAPKSDPASKSKSKSKSKSESHTASSFTRSLRNSASADAINTFGKKRHPPPANDDYFYSMPIPDVIPVDPWYPGNGGGPPSAAPTSIEYPPGEDVPIPPATRKLVDDEFDWSQMRGKTKGKTKGKAKASIYVAPTPPVLQADSLDTFGVFSGGSDDGEYSYRFQDPKQKPKHRPFPFPWPN